MRRMMLLGLALTPAMAATGGHEMVVTEQHLATDVGLSILHRGGNAVDAAVAIGYAEAVVYPCCGNVGGGGFMTARVAGKDYFLDFRETAPAGATADMYRGHPQASRAGWLAVGVPGTVAGLEAARERLGKLSRAADLAPAIALARDGFRLDDYDAEQIDHETAPEVAALYHAPVQAGDVLKQPELAGTLTAIAARGPAGFYQGAVPSAAETAARDGGILKASDFAGYHAKWRDPVHCHYRGYDVTTAAPPSSGGTTLCEALNILSGYDLAAAGYHTAAAINLIAEAERNAFFDRNTLLGDPDFVVDPVEKLTDPAYAAGLRKLITPGRATASTLLPGSAAHEKPETTHYSVVDRSGNAVSVTYTLNGWFGAGVVAPGTGVVMNDEMDDFASAPDQPNMFQLLQGARNAVAPGKRPLSSTTPTLVSKDGRLVMVLGSPGGPRIISITLQTLINVVDYGMSIDQAVAAPRIHEQYQPDVIFYEPDALSPQVQAQLQAMGYHLESSRRFGSEEAILWQNGAWQGANDPRAESGSAQGD